MGAIELNEAECRILGSLIEKENTTPEYYPLSLNALKNACNQKNNRSPLVQYSESFIEETLIGLKKRRLVLEFSKGSRVLKYEQYLRGVLPQLVEHDYAIIGELLLRGPQTIGELKAHASRMFVFPTMELVESIVEELMNFSPPLVIRMEREPGRKEVRYRHNFSREPTILSKEEGDEQFDNSNLVIQLQNDLKQLRSEFEILKGEFTSFKSQFD